MNNNEVLIQMKVRDVDRTLIQMTKKHFNLFFPQMWNNALHKLCDDVEEKIIVFKKAGMNSEPISELEIVVENFRNADSYQDSREALKKVNNNHTKSPSKSVLLPKSERLSLTLDYLKENPKATPTEVLRWSKARGLNLGTMNTIRRQIKEIQEN